MTTQQAVRATGIGQRKFQYWNERGLLAPARGPWSGHGLERDWSQEDLLLALVLDAARRKGIEISRLRAMLDPIRRALNTYTTGPLFQEQLFLAIDRKARKVWRSSDPAALIEHYIASPGLDLIDVSEHWQRLQRGLKRKAAL